VFDFAVIVATILRPTLLQACRSVVEQTVDGAVNLVVGVDYPIGSLAALDEIRRMERPKRKITIINPGYSTSAARGGPFPNPFGGGIRIICSYAANARYVAYLDDDNWYAPDHLETLAHAIKDKHWAFSRRIYVDEATRLPLGEDRWESLGPEKGIYAKKFGGFSDTSTIMLDAVKCHDLFPLWGFPLCRDGTGEDRRIFDALRKRSYGDSGKPSVFYVMRRTDGMHAKRIEWLKSAGVKIELPPSFASVLSEIQPVSPTAGLTDPLPVDCSDMLGLSQTAKSLSRPMRNSPRKVAFVLASSDHGTMIVNRFDYRMIRPDSGIGVGFEILNRSSYSADEIVLTLRLLKLKRSYVGDGVVAIDCGANIGVHTIEWAKAMTGWGSVLAIEAQERIYYALVGNIAINNCFNARAMHAAVGARTGTMQIPNPNYLEAASFGSLELRKSERTEFIGQKVDYSKDKLVEVPAITLDSL
jgi:FkbM family methyltransferase